LPFFNTARGIIPRCSLFYFFFAIYTSLLISEEREREKFREEERGEGEGEEEEEEEKRSQVIFFLPPLFP